MTADGPVAQKEASGQHQEANWEQSVGPLSPHLPPQPEGNVGIAGRGAATLGTPLGLQLRQQLLDAILLFQCRESVFDVVGGNL